MHYACYLRGARSSHQDGLGELAQLPKQAQRRGKLRHAAHLSGAKRGEVVQHELGARPLARPAGQELPMVAGVVVQQSVGCRVADFVKADAVNLGFVCHAHPRFNHVAFDQPQVQLDPVCDARVRDQQCERLAVDALRPAHPAHLVPQADGSRPCLERPLRALGNVAVAELDLHLRADGVGGQGIHDAVCVGVIGDLVPRPVADGAAHGGVVRVGGAQAVHVLPEVLVLGR